MKTGQRVVLIGNHPWAGHAGEYVRDEEIQTLGSTRPIVRLDSGQECFVMNSDQWRVIPEPPRREKDHRVESYVKGLRELAKDK